MMVIGPANLLANLVVAESLDESSAPPSSLPTEGAVVLRKENATSINVTLASLRSLRALASDPGEVSVVMRCSSKGHFTAPPPSTQTTPVPEVVEETNSTAVPPTVAPPEDWNVTGSPANISSAVPTPTTNETVANVTRRAMRPLVDAAATVSQISAVASAMNLLTSPGNAARIPAYSMAVRAFDCAFDGAAEPSMWELPFHPALGGDGPKAKFSAKVSGSLSWICACEQHG
jgi:hypothetical protein